MRRDKRLMYLELTNEIGWGLCAFCKYAEWQGCCDGSICLSPIPVIEEQEWQGEPGTDCWGFQPKVDASMAADIVGLILSLFDSGSAFWARRGDGQIIVRGTAKAQP